MRHADTLAAKRPVQRPDGAAPLPWGRSHWDRLPPELHHLVLNADTSLLTAVTCGQLLAAELRGLQRADVDRLWTDAFDSEWTGDFKRLPRPDARSEYALAVRSRAMLARARLLRAASPLVQLRVAIKRRWPDELWAAAPADIALAAASEGDVELIRSCIAANPLAASPSLVVGAARGGHLDALLLLHDLVAPPWPATAADAAAAGGSIDVLAWLRTCHAEAVAPSAVVAAARAGRLHVLEWMRVNISRIFDVAADSAADSATNISLVQWLNAQGHVKQPAETLHSAVAAGAVDTAAWLCATFSLRLDQDLLLLACDGNHARMVSWMLSQPGVGVDQILVNRAVLARHVSVLDAFIASDRAWLAVIADKVAVSGSCDLLEWLNKRHPGSIEARALDFSVGMERVEAVAYLLEHVLGVEWDIAAARRRARGWNSDAILLLLDRYASRHVSQL
ncbi:hypothetical protein HK105_204182 [Polyrhizophydium stewartii]|uniref:Ankyrin repeat protein n=1 Tax=Polyrhizophydium stewartii TaxID=2732419 RepID=A0ABR4N970_9FUNG